MTDAGLAEERTALARRRTALPFLVIAALGLRASLDAALPGVLLAVVACVGAAAVVRRSPRLVMPAVLVLAVAALAVPAP